MSLVAREAITPTNQSPNFLIVTWISQAAVLMAVAVKVLLSATSTGIHEDDWCILISAVLSIAQVVAVSFQGLNGLGKVESTLSHHELVVYQKAAYAAEILYILTLVTSKLAVVIFLYKITPFKVWRRTMAFVGIFTALWGLSSVFVTAFQCKGPARWQIMQDQCINQVAFWTANSAFNMLIELALIFVPIAMFYIIISSAYNKIILMLCFSLRFSVIAVVALQLYYLYHPSSPSTHSGRSHVKDDFTFSTWPVFLTTQIIQCLSIITTCIPFMRNLFLGLETGMIQTGHVSRRKFSTAATSRSNERPNNQSQLSTTRVDSVDAGPTILQLANWRFNTNDTPSTPRFDPNRPGSGSTVDRSSGRLSDASTLTENSRTPRKLGFNRRSSGSTTDGSRTPTTPTFPRRGSEEPPQRPGLEYTYSRRQVSMIVEDEEEEMHHIDVPEAISETRAMLDENVEVVRPEAALDVSIPTRRLSIPWRSSWGSHQSVLGTAESSRTARRSRGSSRMSGSSGAFLYLDDEYMEDEDEQTAQRTSTHVRFADGDAGNHR